MNSDKKSVLCNFEVLTVYCSTKSRYCLLVFFFVFKIRNALEKERESTDRERVRHQAKLEEIRDKYEAALKQVREELEAERQGHTHLNTSVNKIKKVCLFFSVTVRWLSTILFVNRTEIVVIYYKQKSTQFSWRSNTIFRPVGILEESSKSCCISLSVNILSGSLNFGNSRNLPIVMEWNFR